MLHTYGVYDGQQIAEMVDGLIYRHTGLRQATFQDLYDLSGKVRERSKLQCYHISRKGSMTL